MPNVKLLYVLLKKPAGWGLGVGPGVSAGWGLGVGPGVNAGWGLGVGPGVAAGVAAASVTPAPEEYEASKPLAWTEPSAENTTSMLPEVAVTEPGMLLPLKSPSRAPPLLEPS